MFARIANDPNYSHLQNRVNMDRILVNPCPAWIYQYGLSLIAFCHEPQSVNCRLIMHCYLGQSESKEIGVRSFARFSAFCKASKLSVCQGAERLGVISQSVKMANPEKRV